MDHKPFLFIPGKKTLDDYKTKDTGSENDKKRVLEGFEKDLGRLTELQDKLYAHDKYGVLIILQAMDAAGKDGVIKHVMSGMNPQGCQVKSFKAPSTEELDHDYLWRCNKALPERGNIGIFNRSYYEEVLVTKVHPQILEFQKLPGFKITKAKEIWKSRYDEINQFEKYLVNNGIIVLKFFLHVSKEEQKKRFLSRINDPSKNWKFTINDLNERKYWDDYKIAYGDILANTTTKWAPWYVIPADKKWFMRALVAHILVSELESLNLHYPIVGEEQKKGILKAKEILEKEK